jgi:hypothetical protein
LTPGPPDVATNATTVVWKGGRVFSVLHREEEQGLAEYAIILSLIAVLAVASVPSLAAT